MKRSSAPIRPLAQHVQQARWPKWIFALAGASVGAVVAVALVVPLTLTALTSQSEPVGPGVQLPASSPSSILTKTVPEGSCLSPSWAQRFDDRCR